MIEARHTLRSKLTEVLSGTVARGSIVSVVIRVTGLALSFVQAILAARLLGAEGYGMVAVALSVAQIGATFAVFGYGPLAVREVAAWLLGGKHHQLSAFTRHAVLVALLLSCIAAVLLFAASQAVAEYRDVLFVAALIIPTLAILQLMRGIAQGFGDVAGAQWPGEIMRPLLLIGLVIASLAFAPLSPQSFLVLFALAGLCGALTAAALVFKHLAAHKKSAPAKARKENWLGKAAPFFGLSLLAIIQGELATIMLAIFASPEQAGLYQPIARLTPIIALPAAATAMRYAPRVSEFWNSGQLPRLISVTRTYTLVTSGLTAAATLVLAGLGPWILMAFGPEFVSVAPLLWIVGAAQIFNTGCGPVGYLLTMTGHTRIAAIAKIAGLVGALAGSVALIPNHGSAGAAIAISIGLIIWNIISLIAVRRKLGFDPSLLQLAAASQASGRDSA